MVIGAYSALGRLGTGSPCTSDVILCSLVDEFGISSEALRKAAEIASIDECRWQIVTEVWSSLAVQKLFSFAPSYTSFSFS